jgi:hypothetical protein
LTGWIAVAARFRLCRYVSNEKSNTVSVIDTDKWVVTKTIKVGQRLAASNLRGWKVRAGRDRRRRRIEVIDTATQQVVDSLPSGPDPELFTGCRDPMSPMRTTTR